MLSFTKSFKTMGTLLVLGPGQKILTRIRSIFVARVGSVIYGLENLP